ncbi:MAG: metal ABC transporter permease [Alphaproteobacteria bacterium]|nr:MAG: metal ABC transporter permease [Alphaproteobacteria bacterium]
MHLNDLITPFTEFLFMKKALIACISLSITSGPVGLLLLLRKMSLMGEALSHGIFPGIALSFLLFGFWLPGFIGFAILAGLTLSMLSSFIKERSLLGEDASFSGLYLFSLALGVVLLHHYHGNFNILHLLFGNILSIQDETLLYISFLNAAILMILYFFRQEVLYDCFDPTFMIITRRSHTLYQLIIWGSLTALLVSASLAIGTLMAMGLIMLPAITSRLLFKNIWIMMITSSIIGVIASYLGLLLSFYFDFPTGPLIISILGVVFLGAFLVRRF